MKDKGCMLGAEVLYACLVRMGPPIWEVEPLRPERREGWLPCGGSRGAYEVIRAEVGREFARKSD